MKPKELIFDGSVAYVPLTRGYYATIDAEDAPLVERVNWCAMSEKAPMRYAVRSVQKDDGKWKTIYMHRVVTGANSGKQVDHINHNPLDNRKTNLRICTHSENQQNQRKRFLGRSHLKGVCWHGQRGVWFARIRVNGKSVFLGCYDNEQEAHEAYCKASKELHKEYGCTVNYNQKNSVT